MAPDLILLTFHQVETGSEQMKEYIQKETLDNDECSVEDKTGWRQRECLRDVQGRLFLEHDVQAEV